MSKKEAAKKKRLEEIEAELFKHLEDEERERAENLLQNLYPDEGPLRRELYRPHLAFFKAGKIHRERLVLAGNRTGKSLGIGGYETTHHLTGRYPDWWEGRKFNHPIDCMVAGDTGTTVRDINQTILLGPPTAIGTGLIPRKDIIKTRPKAGGIPDAIESAYIRNIYGGTSILTFKSYAEGRVSFQGTAKHVIWLDEEPPLNIYGECILRTMTTDGIVMATFTPLSGMSEVVMQFLPNGKLPDHGSYIVNE